MLRQGTLRVELSASVSVSSVLKAMVACAAASIDLSSSVDSRDCANFSTSNQLAVLPVYPLPRSMLAPPSWLLTSSMTSCPVSEFTLHSATKVKSFGGCSLFDGRPDTGCRGQGRNYNPRPVLCRISRMRPFPSNFRRSTSQDREEGILWELERQGWPARRARKRRIPESARVRTIPTGSRNWHKSELA